MNIAIITGASSGLGKEFVKQISEKENIDEIWVIARRKEALELLSKNIETKIRVFALDLSNEESIQTLNTFLQKEKPAVKILVNAAGFGKMGNYKEIPSTEINQMINLNCRAAVDMTQIALPFTKKGSRIIQICSTAAFQPMQNLGVYAATKAFLLSYSRALHWELLAKSVHVTAVCPYWIKDTEFISIAKKTDNAKAVRHFPLSGNSVTIVALSLIVSKINLPVLTPGIVSTVHRIACKIIPRFFMQGIWEIIRRI